MRIPKGLSSIRTILYLAVLLPVLPDLGQAVSPQDRPKQPLDQSPDALEEQATKASYNKQFAESVRLFDAAFAAGLNRPDDAYKAAWSSRAGDAAKALTYLERAAGLGFRDAEYMKADSDLASIRSDPRFQSIVEQVQQNEQAYQREHSDPNRAAIVTSDIDLFWDMYPGLQASPHAEALIENEYFRRGSPGLQDFIFARIHSASDLWSTMKRAPKYYAALRPETLRIKEFTPSIRDSFRRMKELYPPSTFPDVYFLIGRMNSGGTTGSSGLLIGADMFGKGPNVPIDELDEWHRTVVSSVTTIPSTVAHELVHYEQSTEENTLLAGALHEGRFSFDSQEGFLF